MVRFMNRANAITLAGACAGLAAALLAVRGHVAYAFAALIVCGLCDVFDGLVARRLERSEEEKTFGGRLDSLVDAVSFGAVPPVVLHEAGLRSPPELLLLGLFLCCAVWRLAYFDTVGLVQEPGARPRYRGLPTTFSALALPLAGTVGFHDPQALRLALDVAVPALALFMIAPLRFPKPSGVWYVLIPACGVGLLVLYAVWGGGHYPGNAAPLVP
ncbi:MAG: hypothetical protein D6731_01180 [Planctomycetota bacterium]|nr:MAG: hypothetical protein D6731_01180 [Planctomycetota bacterium]